LRENSDQPLGGWGKKSRRARFTHQKYPAIFTGGSAMQIDSGAGVKIVRVRVMVIEQAAQS
jgi:hypothetical protein